MIRKINLYPSQKITGNQARLAITIEFDNKFDH